MTSMHELVHARVGNPMFMWMPTLARLFNTSRAARSRLARSNNIRKDIALFALRLTLAAASLAAAAGLWATPASAQNAYVLTTLKPASSLLGMGPAMNWQIDAQNVVTGSALWLTGASSNAFGWGLPGFTVEEFLARWPASTATSVSPTKLMSAKLSPGYMVDMSPDGKLVALNNGIYDISARKTSVTPDNVNLFGMNASGVAAGVQVVLPPVGESYIYTRQKPGTWRALGGFTALPLASNPQGGAADINAQGDVVGWVGDAAESMHAALWRSGQVQVLPEPAGHISHGSAINDAGQILVFRWARTCAGLNDSNCVQGPVQFSLRQPDGLEQPIEAGSGLVVNFARLSPSGAVVGRLQTTAGHANNTDATARAFIWSNGVMQDLNTVAATKGAKLPAGATLVDVMAINAQGSLVAKVLAADKKTVSYVRLTAK